MKKVSCFLTGIMLMFALSCNDKKETLENIILPEGVSNVEVDYKEGKTTISWTLPSDGKVTGVKVIYSLIADGEVYEKFVSKENNSIELKGFVDNDGHKVTIFAIYPGNQLSVGVTVTINPIPTVYRPVTDLVVENLVGRAIISWTYPSDAEMDEKLLGVHVTYSLVAKGEVFEVFVPKEKNSIELDGYNDTDEHSVIFVNEFEKEKFSPGVQAIVEPLPHISNIKVVNVVGGATISYTLSSEEKLLGVRVVYTLEGGEEIEKFVSKDKNSVEVSGYEDSKEHTVTLYVVYDYKETTGFNVKIKPLLLIFDPVLNVHVINTAGGAAISWTLPTTNDDVSGAKVVFSYGSDGKKFEIVVPKPGTSVQIEGFTKSNEHTVIIYATFSGGKISEGVEVKIKPLVPAVVSNEIKGKIGGIDMWIPLDYTYSTVTADWQAAQEKMTSRGDLFVPNNRLVNRGFQHIFEWTSDTGAESQWQAGGDALSEQNLSHYISGGATNQTIPYPLYVTFDMGRKAVYDKLAFLIRGRGGGPAFPVVFDVWGTNNIKAAEDIGDGSKAANIAYWTNWTVANGTDAWKNDWTKIATCNYVFVDGPHALANPGTNRVPSSFNANNHLGNAGTTVDRQRFDGVLPPIIEGNRGLGYDFDLTTGGVTEAFRYLRLEIKLLSCDEQNGNTSRNIQIKALKFWGEYAD